MLVFSFHSSKNVNFAIWMMLLLRFFLFSCIFYINFEFCMETLAHSQQNWIPANERSIKANTLSIYSMKTIMAAIFTQTHCHLFRLHTFKRIIPHLHYTTRSAVSIYDNITSIHTERIHEQRARENLRRIVFQAYDRASFVRCCWPNDSHTHCVCWRTVNTTTTKWIYYSLHVFRSNRNVESVE